MRECEEVGLEVKLSDRQFRPWLRVESHLWQYVHWINCKIQLWHLSSNVRNLVTLRLFSRIDYAVVRRPRLAMNSSFYQAASIFLTTTSVNQWLTKAS